MSDEAHRFYVAWRRSYREAILRHKDAVALEQWSLRRWNNFGGSSTGLGDDDVHVTDVTGSFFALFPQIRGKIRRSHQPVMIGPNAVYVTGPPLVFDGHQLALFDPTRNSSVWVWTIRPDWAEDFSQSAAAWRAAMEIG